jgi:dUTP pyrophosphatase
MRIKIQRLRPDASLPAYAHGPDEDAGMDLQAVEPALLEPGIPQLVPTGLRIELPPGYEAQIRPRSGLALKHAITLPNSPATIDPGYRGEIRVLMENLGDAPAEIHAGDKIANLIPYPVLTAEVQVVDDLAESRRGAGGFGSTGRK